MLQSIESVFDGLGRMRVYPVNIARTVKIEATRAFNRDRSSILF
jgi:hypothetical protein